MFLSHLQNREFQPSFVYHQMVNSVTQPHPHLWSRVEDDNFWAGKGAADDYMFCSLFRLNHTCMPHFLTSSTSSERLWSSRLQCERWFTKVHRLCSRFPPFTPSWVSGVCWTGESAAVCPAGPEIGVINSLCLLQGDNCHFVEFGEMSRGFGSGKALDIKDRPWSLAWSLPWPISGSVSSIILHQH